MNVTLLGDIAGRVAREALNADRVTVGGVLLPSGGTKFIRKRIPKLLPKWRDAQDSDVEFVVQLLLQEALCVTATSIEKESVAWEDFWKDAAEAYQRVAPGSGGSMSFVKAATLIKYILFAHASSLTIAHTINTVRIPRSRTSRKPTLIRESLVLDNEIQGQENIDMFMELWEATNAHQPLIDLLGIHKEVVSLSLSTEQEEPLLLLPDYVAGLTHVAHSKADVLSVSKVSASTATHLHSLLRKSRKYTESSESFRYRFHEIFPSFEHLFPTNAL